MDNNKLVNQPPLLDKYHTSALGGAANHVSLIIFAIKRL